MQLARELGLEEFLLHWPAGLDTIVLEGGRNLPGGQKQRIGLLRASTDSPSLMLTDEPGKNLDQAILNALVDYLGHFKHRCKRTGLLSTRSSTSASTFQRKRTAMTCQGFKLPQIDDVASGRARWVALCALWLAAGCAVVPPAQDTPMPQRVAAFKARADRMLAEIDPKGPGLSVIVMADGQIAYLGNAGLADVAAKRRIDNHTSFELGSLSKPITAMAVLQLVDRKVVGLKDPVRRWIPELPTTWPDVTVRDLLAQQSGIPDFLRQVPLAQISSFDGLTNAGLIDRLRASPTLLFPPGSRSRYNNSNYVLLAEIVARASGMSFHDYLEHRIFQPLGLISSFADGGSAPPGAVEALNFGLTRSTNGIRLRTVGPTGVFSSTDDISKLISALLAGRFLAPDTLQAMISPQSAGATFDDGEHYGYGWAMPVDANGYAKGIFAHMGQKDGFHSIAFVDTVHRLDYVILCNGGDPALHVMDGIRYLFQVLLQTRPIQ